MRRTTDPQVVTLRTAWLSVLASTALVLVLLAVGPAARPAPAQGLLALLVTGPALLLPLAAAMTAVRVLAHPLDHERHPRPPAPSVRAAVAGSGAVGWLGAAVASGCLAGLADRVRSGGAPVTDWMLAAALTLAAVTTIGCAGRARQAWAGDFARIGDLRSAVRPDLVDDAATLLARWTPGSLPARTAARLVAGLDRWSWSPRRHRTGFVVAAGTAAGVAVATWHSVVAGWTDVQAAAVLTLAGGLGVAALLAAGIGWLGLLRPAADAG